MLKKIWQGADAAQKKTLIKSFSLVGVTFICCLMASIVAAGMTFGWFSSNLKSDGNGVALNSDVSGNLIISDNEEDISNTDLDLINGGTPFRISAATDDTRFLPSTHGESDTGLIYVTNQSIINFYNGIENDAEEFEYDEAENDSERHFYTDFTVHIASHGKALSDATLQVSLSATKNVNGAQTPVTSGSLMAASVDIYEDSVSSENYVGTLNVAGLDREFNDHPAEYDSSKTLSSLYLIGGESETGYIPLNTKDHLTYVIRCYFDGALLSYTDQTYIYSVALDTSKVTLNIAFTATGTEVPG